MRIVLFLAALMLPSFAQAHVTASPNEGVAGKYFETGFRVSHGCDGSPTISVTVAFPKGTISVKPQYKPGWTVSVAKSKLEKPVPAGHGKMTDEQFDSVTWSGASLPDDQYDSFGILVKLPDDEGMLWFPVKQVCENGTEEWKNVPADIEAWHDTDHPAPYVRVKPSLSSGHQH